MQGIHDAFEHAGLHVFTCHAGFHEYVYPVMEAGRLIGYFMIGQVNMPETYGDIIAERRDVYQRYGLDEEELRGLLGKLPVMTHEKMLAAGHMLEALAGYIYMKGLVRTYEPPLCERLKVYLQENPKSTLTLDEIAVQLNVSRSTLCHTVRREMNESVNTVIRRMRAKKAVELLRSGMRLNAAAQAAGFSSAGYCARVIRQVLGISHSELLKGENSDEGSGCESAMEI